MKTPTWNIQKHANTYGRHGAGKHVEDFTGTTEEVMARCVKLTGKVSTSNCVSHTFAKGGKLNWEKKIRTRSSYWMFKEIADLLKKKSPEEDVLLKVFSILDGRRAFGSETNSAYARESLRLLMQDEFGVKS